jgi:hypothetical protein
MDILAAIGISLIVVLALLMVADAILGLALPPDIDDN